MEALPYPLARKTVRKYACSNCWGDLEMAADIRSDKHFVLCVNCGVDTKGYVTKFFVNRRRAENAFEERDARRLLQTIGVLPTPPRRPLRDGETETERNLRELGF